MLVATLGAILLTICSGMALGVVTWSPGGLGLNFRSEPQGPPLVTGSDGVWPGGPAHNVPLTVQNTDGSAFEISGVTADLTTLPAACPASAWQVAVPGLLPTVPARSEVTVPLPVSLRDDAPETCQGVTARFPVRIDGLRHPRPLTDAGTEPGTEPGAAAQGATGTAAAAASAAAADPAPTGSASTSADAPTPTGATGATGATGLVPQQLSATATVTVARLGSPGGTATVRGSTVEIVPTWPGSGPAPARYDVEVLGSGSQRTGVCLGVIAPCVDRDAPAAAARRYLVTAWAGSHRHQSGSPVPAWTPPPAPSLAFADGDRPAASALVVTARGADSAYEVELSADGTPFQRLKVASGSTLTRTVSAPQFAPGTHHLVAVARFHGWRAPSATLGLSVSSEGVVEPGPSEEPLPVSSDPAPTSAGPPMATLPTTSAPTASRRTTSPPSTTIHRPVTRPAPAPPQATIENPTPSAADPAPSVPGVPEVVPTAELPASNYGVQGPVQPVLPLTR